MNVRSPDLENLLRNLEIFFVPGIAADQDVLGRVARSSLLRLMISLCSYVDRNEVITSIQDVVDGICASVPFNLGDLMAPQSIHQGNVKYPSSPVHPLPERQQVTAMAYGGWYLFAPFKETMKVQSYIRKGQIEWLRAQLLRLAKVFEVTPR